MRSHFVLVVREMPCHPSCCKLPFFFFFSDSEYRDRLELKSLTDRTLGVGVIQSDSTFLLLTATLMMKASIDIDKIQNFDPQCVIYYFDHIPSLLISSKDRPYKSHQVNHDSSHPVRLNIRSKNSRIYSLHQVTSSCRTHYILVSHLKLTKSI